MNGSKTMQLGVEEGVSSALAERLSRLANKVASKGPVSPPDDWDKVKVSPARPAVSASLPPFDGAV